MPKIIFQPDQPIRPINCKIQVAYSHRLGAEVKRGWATATCDHLQDIFTPEALQCVEAANAIVGLDHEVVEVEIFMTWGKK